MWTFVRDRTAQFYIVKFADLLQHHLTRNPAWDAGKFRLLCAALSHRSYISFRGKKLDIPLYSVVYSRSLKKVCFLMLRPTDLQDNFSKAPMAAREQHVLQTRPDQAQHNIARQQDRERILDHSRISPNENAEPNENRVDDRQGSQRDPKRKPRRPRPSVKDSKSEEVRPRLDLNKALLIDITI